jgi:nicotinate-nucleotide--dimethylbenzimidazole phosphoribosyltransferase
VPVLLDGVISVSAGLVACAMVPAARGYLIAGHLSAEPGAAVALHHLDMQPLLDLGMRLGEGSGATLAIPLVQAAARVLSEMATFGEASVDDAAAGPSPASTGRNGAAQAVTSSSPTPPNAVTR